MDFPWSWTVEPPAPSLPWPTWVAHIQVLGCCHRSQASMRHTSDALRSNRYRAPGCNRCTVARRKICPSPEGRSSRAVGNLPRRLRRTWHRQCWACCNYQLPALGSFLPPEAAHSTTSLPRFLHVNMSKGRPIWGSSSHIDSWTENNPVETWNPFLLWNIYIFFSNRRHPKTLQHFPQYLIAIGGSPLFCPMVSSPHLKQHSQSQDLQTKISQVCGIYIIDIISYIMYIR